MAILEIQCFNGQVVVGIDADVCCRFKAVAYDLHSRQLGVVQQSAGSRFGEVATRAYGNEPTFRFDDITIAGDDQRGVFVGHRQQRLQPTQHAIGTPVLGQFHCSTRQLTRMRIQLRLEPFKQREGICRTASETCQYPVTVQASHLLSVSLHDDVAHADLAIAADDDLVASADRADRRTPELFHNHFPQLSPLSTAGACAVAVTLLSGRPVYLLHGQTAFLARPEGHSAPALCDSLIIMQLTVPHRTVADTGSFPVNPDGVAAWLKDLRPLESEADAREVYRGLKHSNRLHNDVDQRRAVLSCFIPALRELQNHLSELSHAQPLPLTRAFSRSARLRDALLREEVFAFKILLSDSKSPLADDARRAMQALARQVESVAHAYRTIPDALIQDAHQLYAMAEKHKLLSSQQGSELLSLQDHYRFILLVSVADLAQQRVRQLQLILDFLRASVEDIHIEKTRDTRELQATDYAINLQQGSRPEPALSLPGSQPEAIRWFSIAPLLYRIDKHSSSIRPNPAGLLGSDTLERQSLARLHVALSRMRHRRTPRRIVHEPHRVVFGHREVCAHLLYRPEETPALEESGWESVNMSVQGMCLANRQCRAGLVQVGELISVTMPNQPLRAASDSASSKINALLGVVRWVRADGKDGIVMGVEFLATSVLPVRVTRDDPPSAHPADRSAGGDTGTLARDPATVPATVVGENALIIACKVQRTVLQTMLMPSYLFQSGDRLTASQGGRSRKVQLRKCLQANGLFSQFSLTDA